MPKWEKCEPDSEPVYELTEEKSIKFYPCGVESWHYKDIEYKFCAYCGRFITKEKERT